MLPCPPMPFPRFCSLQNFLRTPACHVVALVSGVIRSFIAANSLPACPLSSRSRPSVARPPSPLSLSGPWPVLGTRRDLHTNMTVTSTSYPVDNGDAAIFTQTNIAVWVLTCSSGAFLVVRLWCRHRFSKLWWDDALLTVSWVCFEEDSSGARLHPLASWKHLG